MAAPRLVIVGIDASADSRAALEWAVGLAGAVGADVVAVHAVGLLEASGYRDAPDLETLLQEVGDPSTGTSPRVTVTREPGPAAESLLRVAEREGADLIVVGSRGLGGTARQLGSTSEAVVQHSRLPVVIVPRP
jgi:nucleotide-binding universal stress UspA family protein